MFWQCLSWVVILCFSMETGGNCKQSDKKCFLTNIKTCIGHCRIFLHHSPQEGNLGMKINSLLTFTFGDLHFRLAFPWYSYSPTLKFRQLDMSFGKIWTGVKISLFTLTAEQGRGMCLKTGRFLEGGWRGWCGVSHCIAIHSWPRPPDPASLSRLLFPLSKM